MKQLFKIGALLLVASLAFVACSKDDDELNPPAYEGTWIHVFSKDGMPGKDILNLSNGSFGFKTQANFLVVWLDFFDSKGNYVATDSSFTFTVKEIGMLDIQKQDGSMTYYKEGSLEFEGLTQGDNTKSINYKVNGSEMTFIFQEDFQDLYVKGDTILFTRQ